MTPAIHWRGEARLLWRHPLIWIALAVTAGFSWVVSMGSPASPGEELAELLRQNLFFPMFMLPFIAGALGPIFYLREVDHGLAEIYGSYPFTASQWLTTRLGSFFLLLCLAAVLSQSVFLGAMVLDGSPDALVLLRKTVFWLLVVHAPACLLWASFLAWLSSRKANSGLLYFAAAFVWLSYIALSAITGMPLLAGSIVAWEPLKQVMLVFDPLAAATLVNPMPADGWLQSREANLTIGRAFWLAGAMLLIGSIKSVPTLVGNTPIRAQKPLTFAFSSSETAGNSRRIAGMEHITIHLRYVWRDRVFPLLSIGWVALLFPEVFGGMDWAEPLSRVIPDSRDALNRVTGDLIPGAGALLLLYTADRICRMYQATRMQELFASTSYRPWRLVTVQLTSLCLVAAYFVFLAALTVMAAQVMAQSAIQPAEYVRQLAPAFAQLLLFCASFVAVHGLLHHRIAANLVGLLLIVSGLSSLVPTIGLEHPLWRPLNLPLVIPDHILGFGGNIRGAVELLIFWGAICLAAILAAIAAHHRTLPFAQMRLHSFARQPAATLAIVGLVIATWQGTAIDRKLGLEGALETSAERIDRRADYEGSYASWQDVYQPEVEAVETLVDFYPQENRARLRAKLTLVNRSKGGISDILVGLEHPFGRQKIEMDRARMIVRDEALGQTVFKVDQPLNPGDRATLHFETNLSQSGLVQPNLLKALRPEFNILSGSGLLPHIGFKRELTLRVPENRRRAGLPSLKVTPPSRLSPPLDGSLGKDRVTFETRVSTDAGQYAIAPGRLIRHWVADGRSNFHYRSERPIRSMPSFLSVPWQPSEWPAGPNQIQMFTPRPVSANDSTLLGARDTLSWLDREVAPYPGSVLRIVAVPEIGPGGYAMPQVVLLSNRLSFRAQPEKSAGFNQAYRRAVHEAAHQWFGHLIGYGIPEERAFLVESLAKYAELVMVERRYGKTAMRALVAWEQERYRQARLDLSQPIMPLIDAEETEDKYSRATLTFACMRERVGDEPILYALQRLAARSEQTNTPVRSVDFVSELAAASNQSMTPAIFKLFLSGQSISELYSALGCEIDG